MHSRQEPKSYMMRFLISQMEDYANVSELWRPITILEAVIWINNAWRVRQQRRVMKCFMVYGFTVISQLSGDVNGGNMTLLLIATTLNMVMFLHFNHDINYNREFESSDG